MVDSLSQYWDFQYRQADKRDLGHVCKECKKPFKDLFEMIAVRRGGRIELRYHKQCFSGQADPRTQQKSSFTNGKWAGSQQFKAPKEMYKKMRTNAHF